MNYIYVNDVDATFAKTSRAGAIKLIEPENRFYGNSGGGIRDPEGNIWWISSHLEDVSQEYIEKQARLT